MKNSKTIACLAIICLLTAAAAYAKNTMSVQVKKTQARTAPSFLSKITATLNYGQQVTVLEKSGDWVKTGISTGSTGWVHMSALTTKKIVFKTGGQGMNTGASGEEVALAGKGFNEKVESEYKTRNPNISFKWIDYMEKNTVSSEKMISFLKKGGLSLEGGK